MIPTSPGTGNAQTCAAAFDTVAQAENAIRRLHAAGFSDDQLAVVCPAQFEEHFRATVPVSGTVDAGHAMAAGGAIGAALGGIALAATVLTGGIGGLAAASVLIGGGAMAGGFGNLIASKGYESEAEDASKRAIERGQIVVGVEVRHEDGGLQFAEAQRILGEAGGDRPIP